MDEATWALSSSTSVSFSASCAFRSSTALAEPADAADREEVDGRAACLAVVLVGEALVATEEVDRRFAAVRGVVLVVLALVVGLGVVVRGESVDEVVDTGFLVVGVVEAVVPAGLVVLAVVVELLPGAADRRRAGPLRVVGLLSLSDMDGRGR